MSLPLRDAQQRDPEGDLAPQRCEDGCEARAVGEQEEVGEVLARYVGVVLAEAEAYAHREEGAGGSEGHLKEVAISNSTSCLFKIEGAYPARDQDVVVPPERPLPPQLGEEAEAEEERGEGGERPRRRREPRPIVDVGEDRKLGCAVQGSVHRYLQGNAHDVLSPRKAHNLDP